MGYEKISELFAGRLKEWRKVTELFRFLKKRSEILVQDPVEIVELIQNKVERLRDVDPVWGPKGSESIKGEALNCRRFH